MSDTTSSVWAPQACTLPTVQRLLRRAEFDDVFTSSTGVQRLAEGHVRFRLAGSAGLADRVRDLAGRENECCSFFTFTVAEQPPDLVIFDIEVPVGQVDVLDALVERASQVRIRS
jgi:hypothetical protein